MENIVIKIVPVMKTKENLNTNTSKPLRSDCLNPINWENTKDINKTIINQIKANRIFLDLIENSCNNKTDINLFFNSDENYNFEKIVKENKISEHIRTIKYSEDLCNKFSKLKYNINEALSRDRDFYNDIPEEKYNNYPRNIVILIYNNEYYGHIYCWKVKNLCFCIGIRARIDKIFIENSLKNISYYLLEGVRKFAIDNNCEKICVILPIGIMPQILSSLGFIEMKMANNMYLENEYIMCYVKNSKDKIIENEIIYK